MEKVYGSPKRQDGLYKIGRNKWELIYGFGIDGDPNNPADAERGWNWRQRFTHRPTIEEMKEAIVSAIKEESDYQLRYGFRWNGITVEYSEALKSDLTGILVALQGGLMQFPIEVNLGSASDGIPTVYSFTNLEEIGAVATGIANHRAQVSKDEWGAILALGDLAEFQIEK